MLQIYKQAQYFESIGKRTGYDLRMEKYADAKRKLGYSADAFTRASSTALRTMVQQDPNFNVDRLLDRHTPMGEKAHSGASDYWADRVVKGRSGGGAPEDRAIAQLWDAHGGKDLGGAGTAAPVVEGYSAFLDVYRAGAAGKPTDQSDKLALAAWEERTAFEAKDAWIAGGGGSGAADVSDVADMHRGLRDYFAQRNPEPVGPVQAGASLAGPKADKNQDGTTSRQATMALAVLKENGVLDTHFSIIKPFLAGSSEFSAQVAPDLSPVQFATALSEYAQRKQVIDTATARAVGLDKTLVKKVADVSAYRAGLQTGLLRNDPKRDAESAEVSRITSEAAIELKAVAENVDPRGLGGLKAATDVAGVVPVVEAVSKVVPLTTPQKQEAVTAMNASDAYNKSEELQLLYPDGAFDIKKWSKSYQNLTADPATRSQMAALELQLSSGGVGVVPDDVTPEYYAAVAEYDRNLRTWTGKVESITGISPDDPRSLPGSDQKARAGFLAREIEFPGLEKPIPRSVLMNPSEIDAGMSPNVLVERGLKEGVLRWTGAGKIVRNGEATHDTVPARKGTIDISVPGHPEIAPITGLDPKSPEAEMLTLAAMQAAVAGNKAADVWAERTAYAKSLAGQRAQYLMATKKLRDLNLTNDVVRKAMETQSTPLYQLATRAATLAPMLAASGDAAATDLAVSLAAGEIGQRVASNAREVARREELWKNNMITRPNKMSEQQFQAYRAIFSARAMLMGKPDENGITPNQPLLDQFDEMVLDMSSEMFVDPAAVAKIAEKTQK
jgi:hypothetical protein